MYSEDAPDVDGHRCPYSGEQEDPVCLETKDPDDPDQDEARDATVSRGECRARRERDPRDRSTRYHMQEDDDLPTGEDAARIAERLRTDPSCARARRGELDDRLARIRDERRHRHAARDGRSSSSSHSPSKPRSALSVETTHRKRNSLCDAFRGVTRNITKAYVTHQRRN